VRAAANSANRPLMDHDERVVVVCPCLHGGAVSTEIGRAAHEQNHAVWESVSYVLIRKGSESELDHAPRPTAIRLLPAPSASRPW
jgi:hypothetical protein